MYKFEYFFGSQFRGLRSIFEWLPQFGLDVLLGIDVKLSLIFKGV